MTIDDFPEWLASSEDMPLAGNLAAQAFSETSDFHDAILRRAIVSNDELVLEINRPYFVRWRRYEVSNIKSARLCIALRSAFDTKIQSDLRRADDLEIYSILIDNDAKTLNIDVEGVYGVRIPANLSTSTLRWIKQSSPKSS
jgi:hypothetical protein